jgi:caffeoyl-CoA O-methyltransferase
LLCCDVSEEWTAIAREAWAQAGVADRIELRLAPAGETLRSLPDEPTFDFAFVDADKPNYPAYLEKLLPLLRTGGLIAVDNTLAVSGEPIVRLETRTAKALRAFNELARGDERVDFALLTIGEGLTLLRKR